MNDASTDPRAPKPQAGDGRQDPPGQATEPAPKPRGMRGSAKSMVISMIVVIAAVLGWLAMVPRVSSVSRPVADVDGIAREVSHTQRWDVAVADGLPDEWKPTNVRMLTPKHQQRTWQAGYTGPDSAYVAVRQTKDGTAAWVHRQVGEGAKAGSTTIDGATWTKYRKESNDQLSLLRAQPISGLTTVVTGTGSWKQLEMLAGALVPYSATDHSPTAAPSGGA